MGTPEFAVPPLTALLDAGYAVAAVCAQPDRPSGRGNRVAAGPVKALAARHGIPVLQFERIRRREGVAALTALAPDLFVTAAFGQILSPKVLAIPRMGTVNLHASLLPAYRGPAPVAWSIIQGERVTGVTTMMTDAGVDTGDILLSRPVEILPEETAGELTARLAAVGADLLVETIRRLERGDCPRVPQDEAKATRQPMLEKAHGRVDWTLPAATIVNWVRGVTPWPGAFTETPEGVLKIGRVRALESGKSGAPGQVLEADPRRGLVIACGAEALEVLELQAPSSKRMESRAYLAGHPLAPGVRWGGNPQ
jgi:methionyl-tRNA formyltransferase